MPVASCCEFGGRGIRDRYPIHLTYGADDQKRRSGWASYLTFESVLPRYGQSTLRRLAVADGPNSPRPVA